MVKIIYCGYRATYAAYVMAAIHTGMYNEHRLPSREAMERQWNICDRYGEQYGNLIYMGLDENLNEVYILGCKGFFEVIKMEYEGINDIFGIDDTIRYVDCRPWDGFLSNFISRINNYRWLRRGSKRLFLYWLKRVYIHCSEKVQREKQSIMAGERC